MRPAPSFFLFAHQKVGAPGARGGHAVLALHQVLSTKGRRAVADLPPLNKAHFRGIVDPTVED